MILPFKIHKSNFDDTLEKWCPNCQAREDRSSLESWDKIDLEVWNEMDRRLNLYHGADGAIGHAD